MNKKDQRKMRVLVVAFFLCAAACSGGCRRPQGLPSAADGGTKAVEQDKQPNASSSTPTTGTDSTGRPSGSSGGTTGSDPAESTQRAGAGGGGSASQPAGEASTGSQVQR
jgi:hypothetical protein